jgi:predicted naringenin-chalcone synthase
MSELLSVSTALPEHRVSASETKRHLAAFLPANTASRYSRMVDLSGNETRYGVLPLDQLRRLSSLEARNETYRHHAVRLGEAVARDALGRAGLRRARSAQSSACRRPATSCRP